MFLPPNSTALIQPMDQNVIQNIKLRYRKLLLMCILNDPVHNQNLENALKKNNFDQINLQQGNADTQPTQRASSSVADSFSLVERKRWKTSRIIGNRDETTVGATHL
ncbi:hypothetical protein J437_LFUL015260 [Ladona fulva]|uniref:DDE-1 domain-containing protein n=1 Tax=Ladona fulva TaxID=123851 RepID=A0A8K0KU58_LADFU|nr:hypothetical protein J437_LFUL015260 [Ladona fulva]